MRIEPTSFQAAIAGFRASSEPERTAHAPTATRLERALDDLSGEPAPASSPDWMERVREANERGDREAAAALNKYRNPDTAGRDSRNHVDPAKPIRCRCPHCGSTQLRALYTVEADQGVRAWSLAKDGTLCEDDYDGDENTGPATPTEGYTCGNCLASLTEHELIVENFDGELAP